MRYRGSSTSHQGAGKTERASDFEHLAEIEHRVPVARRDGTAQGERSEGGRQWAPALAVRVPCVDLPAGDLEQLRLPRVRVERRTSALMGACERKVTHR